jgi:hypothetical protein
VGAVVAVGWLAAGCTGGGGPGPSPSVEEPVVPAPSETPKPTPTETGPVKPERPAAMERDDAEGAAAAAEYFLELYPYVMATGDTVEWDAMTWAETCGFCTGVRDTALEIRSAGDFYSGSDTTVDSAEAGEVDTLTGGRAVIVDVVQGPHIRTASDGEVITEGGEVAARLHVDVLFTQGQWYIVGASEMSA